MRQQANLNTRLQSDWVEEERIGGSEFIDTTPWTPTEPVAYRPSESRTQESAPAIASARGMTSSSNLQGFKLLSPFQLKFIPQDQIEPYMDKLQQWFNLSPEEKFDL
jgi:hypothetical protein